MQIDDGIHSNGIAWRIELVICKMLFNKNKHYFGICMNYFSQSHGAQRKAALRKASRAKK